MKAERKSIEPTIHQASGNDDFTCSKCGRVLMSSHEGIIGDNNIAFCEPCYKSLLFPNLRECSMEVPD